MKFKNNHSLFPPIGGRTMFANINRKFTYHFELGQEKENEMKKSQQTKKIDNEVERSFIVMKNKFVSCR